MNLSRSALILSGLTLLLAQSVSLAQQPDPSQSVPETGQAVRPKIGIDEARKIALTNAKGEIVHEKLDRVANKICYSFDIKSGADIKEVIVDSDSGQVIIIEKAPPAKPRTIPRPKMPTVRPH